LTAKTASITLLKYLNFTLGNFERTSLSATVPVGTAISLPSSCCSLVIFSLLLQPESVKSEEKTKTSKIPKNLPLITTLIIG